MSSSNSLIEETLKMKFPDATFAECTRFARACQHPDAKRRPIEVVREEAEELLGKHLEWRKIFGLENIKMDMTAKMDDDSEDWKFAMKKALGEEGDEKKEETDNSLLQFIYVHKSQDGTPITDKHGRSILHVLPAMIDNHATTAETFGHCVSIYLDKKFDRNSDEKVTVYLDARAGEGWANPKIIALASFIQTISNIVQVNHPDRFHAFLIFPVPWYAVSVWGVVKRFFRHDIRDSFILVKGPAGVDAPLPKKSLEDHVNSDVIDSLETFRKGKFLRAGS